MYSASFIFTSKNLDDEFWHLDKLILQAAEATTGYLGKENWISDDGETRNSIYYWENKDALAEFARHPQHLDAKRRYQEWYGGFHVVLCKVEKSYGDGAINTFLPNQRKRN